MEKFHFSQFNFPIREKVVEPERPKTKLKKIRRMSLNPQKSSSDVPSPSTKHQKVLPIELEKFSKTSISTIEDHYQKTPQPTKPIRIKKSTQNDSFKVYLKIINTLEKKKLKRIQNKKEPKTGKQDNPWRYSLTSSSCVFDVNLVARSTFHPDPQKKEV
jgi:hypothetical protein